MVAIDAEVSEDIRGGLTTADGKPLKQALAHAQARARRKALLLVVPLLAFILITFVMPIGQLLFRSIHNDGFSANMPQISAWFDETSAGDAPDETAYAALVADIAASAEARTIGVVGTRVNYEMSGTRSLFTAAGRRAEDLQPPYREALLELNAKWGDPQLWGVMRSVSSAYSANFYLAALDLARDANGDIIRAPEDRRIYGMLFMRTLWLSALITGLCLILAYPVAHLLAVLPLAKSNLLMILVLLPFWTSILVRVAAWIVLLQSGGLINGALLKMGLIDEPLQLVFNRTGVYIAMVHILLPFMILPIYSVMKNISPSYMRAAVSLGCHPFASFWRVYFPQTLAGVGAGCLLVFIISIGYYITPALLGSPNDQMVSYFVAFYTNTTINWGMATALGGLLLLATMLLYVIYSWLVGASRLRLG